jgi:hypothetical protein
LLISIVQYNLTTRGCVKDVAAMEKSQQDFLAKEAQVNAAKQQAASQTYTVTN